MQEGADLDIIHKRIIADLDGGRAVCRISCRLAGASDGAQNV